MRDQSFVGQTIECPECRSSVRIRQNANGSIVGEIVVASVKADVKTEPTSAAGSSEQDSPLRAFISSPVYIGWGVASILTVGLILWMTLPHEVREHASTVRSAVEDTDTELTDSSATNPRGDEPSPVEQQSPVELKLSTLFEDLTATRTDTGAFPAGTAGEPALLPEERFSWIATLAALSDPDGPQPRLDQAWNHRANERFVRQRKDGLLNPAVAQRAGADGYPATHFVGVSGVGPDAEHLPAGHPRAGVFGDDRLTTLDHISDGLGNTLLVAGVETYLGSWAAAGKSTMRSFTAEPYVRGPDGFGTGQQDGMLVLMADGSTRFLSATTDPTLIRRMAAAADGLPLDVNVPGEPGGATAAPDQLVANDPEDAAPDQLEIEKVEELVADLAQPIEEPLDDPPAADDPPVDLDAMLSQPIARFAQEKPVPATEVLATLEEMLTIKIETSSLPEQARARLDQQVVLTLNDTTVGGILDAVLKEVRLTSVARDNRLQVVEQESVTD